MEVAQRPAWQTDELEDEWVDMEEASMESQKLDLGGGSMADRRQSIIFRNREDDTDDDEDPKDDDSAPVGTFLVRVDEPALPLMANKMGDSRGKGVKDIFTPLALETMFEPPTPVENVRLAEVNSSKASIPRSATAPVKPSKLSQVINRSFFEEGQSSEGSESTKHDGREVERVVDAEEEREEQAEAQEQAETTPREKVEETEEQQSGQHDEIVETDMPDMVVFNGTKLSRNCRFTFSVSPSEQDRNATDSQSPRALGPLAQSTPIPPYTPTSSYLPPSANPPQTDPRLRLFQFQYDTFTREHLSAMVDSIGINTPSGNSNDSPEADQSFARFRSTKRIKLTPSSSEEEEESVNPLAKTKTIKDYLGESRALMQQIKRARDLSMLSVNGQTTADDHQKEDHGAFLHPSDATESRPPSSLSNFSSNGSKSSKYSSLAIRQQALDLMQQIKSDMKGSKRLFSEYTDKSSVDLREGHSQISARTHYSPVFSLSRSRPDKENDPSRASPLRGSRKSRSISLVKSPNRSKTAASPCKSLGKKRSVGSVDDIHGPVFNLGDEHHSLRSSVRSSKGKIRSPNVTFLAPSAPASSNAPFVRGVATEDLNRFVSSSTNGSANTGTTLTSGSFVKHAGPVHIVRIAPTDVPELPDRIGKMVFDKDTSKWVKVRAGETLSNPQAGGAAFSSVHPTVEGEGESEDPFKDIESLRSDDAASYRHSQGSQETDGVQADDEIEPTQELPLETSYSDSEFEEDDPDNPDTFTFDDPAAGVVQVMTGIEDDTTSESDLDDDPACQNEPQADEEPDEELITLTASLSLNQYIPQSLDITAMMVHTQSGSHIHASPSVAAISSTPVPTEKRIVQPPRSALKSASVTPLAGGSKGRHRRSVSFSDGRRDGQILGLNATKGSSPDQRPDWSMMGLRMNHQDQGSNSQQQSARFQRIANILENFDTPGPEDEPSFKNSQRALAYNAENNDRSKVTEISRRSFTRSQSVRARPVRTPRSGSARMNGTFLTECSFGVAHDRLIKVVTDVQPFEPHWELLNQIDLSNRKLDSVARMKEILPNLDTLNLNNNLISWLSGVPGSVRSLSIASNALSSMTSFAHMRSLQKLDISRNEIDSLHQLGCLHHLTELRAEGNRITDLEGLEHLENLIKVNLQGNHLRQVDLTQCRWSQLEHLDLSCNRLEKVHGLVSLGSLVSMNLENNRLVTLSSTACPDHDTEEKCTSAALLSLRVLRLSGNQLRTVNIEAYSNLRTLYLDNNCLGSKSDGKKLIQHLSKLRRLENLSLRNQSGGGARDRNLHLEAREIRDVKRLYLSGNPNPFPLIKAPSKLGEQAFYNLVYLELAACRLTSLPSGFHTLVPNVRALNLNYNFLETEAISHGLSGLRRLRKLTIVGGRMASTKGLLKMLRGMPEMEMLDFRMNPCTLGWYLPLFVRDAPGALQPSEVERNDSSVPIRQSGDVDSGRLNSMANPSIDQLANTSQQVQKNDLASTDAFAAQMPSQYAENVGTHHKQGGAAWEALDSQFRRDLPGKLYAGRLAYRGLVMRACPRIDMLDGIRISEQEKKKADGLLQGILEKKP